MPNRKEPRLEIEEQQPTAEPREQTTAPKPKPKTNTESDVPPPSSKAANQFKASSAYKPNPSEQPSQPKNTSSTSARISDPGGSSSGSSSIKAWLGLILALLALGLLAWQFMQSKQQLESMQVLANRVAELEIRLAETGDDLSSTGNSFNEKLQWADSEIRKLWVVAHQRNRPAIETLENKHKQLEQGLTKADKQLAEQSLALRKDLKKHTDELNFHIKELNQRLTEVTIRASSLDERLRNQDLRTKLTDLDKRVTQLATKVSKTLPDDYEAKVLEQQEILTSLEASRNQLVSRVTRLMEEVRELQQNR